MVKLGLTGKVTSEQSLNEGRKEVGCTNNTMKEMLSEYTEEMAKARDEHVINFIFQWQRQVTAIQALKAEYKWSR